MVKQIVDFMIEEGTTETNNGSWTIYYDEIENIFNVTKNWLYNHREDIIDELDSRKEILSETWGEEDESFNMNFCLNACKNWDGTLNWGCCDW